MQSIHKGYFLRRQSKHYVRKNLRSCTKVAFLSISVFATFANNAQASYAVSHKVTDTKALSPQRQHIFTELNKVRSVGRYCGHQYFAAVPAVTWNVQLASSAQQHAEDMARLGYFSHRSRDGRTLRERAEQAGYRHWTGLGENIAAGLGVREVLQGWLNSVGHCQTLMDPQLHEVGIGYIFRPSSPQQHYWVQNFGTRHMNISSK